jgi:ParB family chromosome partitioning protein
VTARALPGLAAIDLADIHPSPNNVREALTGIEELAGSMREVGLIQPLVVQKIPGHPGFQIVAGHRRHAAAKLLGLASVPCVIRRDMLPDEELVAMLVENGQRADLDPIEEARALNTLRSGGLTIAEVARKIGRSVGYVDSRLMLLHLPLEEQDAVRAGHYTLDHAKKLVRTERAAERERLRPTSRPIGRPKGVRTRPYFGDTHPLARAVRTRCNHIGKPKVAGVGCGECWESVIRADERQHLEQEGAA